MTKLPNILSCSRFIFSVLLVPAADNPVCFIMLYCVCGFTDIADGYLARKYNAVTKLGSRLDSAGDLIFFIVWIFIFFRFVNSENIKLIITGMVIVAIIRVTNFIITKVKFKQWSMMHTIGNKISGLILFFSLPLYVLNGSVPFWSLWVIGLITTISALEETVILLRNADYDADKRVLYRR